MSMVKLFSKKELRVFMMTIRNKTENDDRASTSVCLLDGTVLDKMH